MTQPTWHAMTTDDVARTLDTDPARGLSAAQAEERLTRHGPNELTHEERPSPLRMFLGQFANVLIVILLAAVVLSAAVGEVVDAAIILVIVLFCAVLGFVQEYRAEQALDALKKMLSPTTSVLRDGAEARIPSAQVVPGDVVLLEAGDRVPADARIIEAHSLRCDEAPLTGESVPVGKGTDPVPEGAGTADRRNMTFTGTTVTYGRGRAVVTATGMETAFGQIAREVATVETVKTPLEKRTEEIGKWLGIIALTICVLVAGFSIARQAVHGTVDFPFIVSMIMFAVSLAVAAVPEALAAIVTGALAIGMRQMAKRGALVRRMPAVETLGCTTVICTDKTGTLTRGEMTVRALFTVPPPAGPVAPVGSGAVGTTGAETEVTGSGYEPKGRLRPTGRNGDAAAGPPPREVQALLLAGILCNDAELLPPGDSGQWAIRGDPTEAALVVAALKLRSPGSEDAAADCPAWLAAVPELPDAGCALHVRGPNPRVEEFPFSSERKRMTTVHDLSPHAAAVAGAQYAAFMKGAPEVVLARCDRVLSGGEVRPLTEADRAAVLAAAEGMAGRALRVLALSMLPLEGEAQAAPLASLTEDTAESGHVLLGLAGMMDPPRDEAKDAVATCRRVGIRPVMITGDHRLTAEAVAHEIGIHREGDVVLTGDGLAALDDATFADMVDKVSVYARVSPMDKLRIVKAWKARGDVVAMTGDGVNDAPALKQADIGVAMGIAGTEVAREAADMVLTDDNFASIVKAIELGRWIYDNIKKYLTFLLRCNITEVAVIGGMVLLLGPDYLPLLPAAILYINLATDGLPALALGVAPPDPDIMDRPPRDPRESVFTRDVTTFVLLAVCIEIPLFFGLFLYDLSDIGTARTEMFFLFIVIEMIIALNFRSMRFSIVQAPPHGWLLLAIVWEVVLIVLLMQFEPVREAFGIHMPDGRTLGIIAGFGVLVFASMEAAKVFIRKRMGTGTGLPG
ncbi:cation-translocating P-type ATPase [Nitratidesulfovibrio sp. 1201_IL3209]|uniref:cation-translocating P-type ATPase n=1 Tax=Nitratidesulfovibrio sp. 1201_IL3209 TaxID=3084053 RepID=UPI002FD8D5DD